MKPCSGSCSIPSTCVAAGIPAISSTVGAMSITCVNWLRRPPGVGDHLRVADDQRVARATEVRGDLLAPVERTVARPRPGGRVVRGEQVLAPRLEPAVLEEESHLLLGRQRDPVQRRQLVERAAQGAFHARAVVTPDPDDKGVVELAHLLDLGENAADVPVGVLRVAGIDLHLAGVQAPLGLAQRVPLRKLVVLCQLGIGRDDAELLLARERPLPKHVPAVVELALVPVRPLSRHVMGGVAAAGGVVHEPRRARPLRPDAAQPVNCLLGHVVRKVVGLPVLALGNAVDLLVLADERVVLARLTPEKAPVVVEAEAGRPAVEGPARALLVVRCQVPLADAGGQVPVLLQDPRQRRAVPGDGGVVAGERAGELGHEPEPDPVLVASGEHGGPRRRADGRHVEAVVTQPFLRHSGVVRACRWARRTCSGCRSPRRR